jgi:hypothetical protein
VERDVHRQPVLSVAVVLSASTELPAVAVNDAKAVEEAEARFDF